MVRRRRRRHKKVEPVVTPPAEVIPTVKTDMDIEKELNEIITREDSEGTPDISNKDSIDEEDEDEEDEEEEVEIKKLGKKVSDAIVDIEIEKDEDVSPTTHTKAVQNNNNKYQEFKSLLAEGKTTELVSKVRLMTTRFEMEELIKCIVDGYLLKGKEMTEIQNRNIYLEKFILDIQKKEKEEREKRFNEGLFKEEILTENIVINSERVEEAHYNDIKTRHFIWILFLSVLFLVTLFVL